MKNRTFTRHPPKAPTQPLKTAARRFRTAGVSWMLPLLLALPGAARAQWEYTTTNGLATITGLTVFFGTVILPSGPVTIPGTINGLPVTGIGYETFNQRGLQSTTSVTIPASVTNIAGGAFGDCRFLNSIYVAPGNPAYSSVAGVLFDKSQTTLVRYPPGRSGTSYTIPNSVTNLGDGAFGDCLLLNSIYVAAGNPAYMSVGGVLFDKSRTTLVQYPPGNRGTYYTLSNTVTNIADGAFGDCILLNSITVNTNNPAFISVSGVLFDKGQTTLVQYPPGKSGTSYTIPNGVTRIGASVFERCTNLASITIPSSVICLGEEAFGVCGSLTNVSFEGNAPVVGSSSFDGDLATV